MSDLARLIMLQGQQSADWQREKYDRLGSAVSNLGATIGGSIEQKKEAQALAKRDAAWMQFVEQWDGDPKTAVSMGLRTFGPTKEGATQVEALLSAGKILEGRGTPEDPQRVVNALRDKPDAYWQRAWPGLAKVAQRMGYQPSAEFNPEEKQIILEMFPAPKSDLEKVETVDDQGRAATAFVSPTPGAMYPKPPEPQKAGARSIDALYAEAIANGDMEAADRYRAAAASLESAKRPPKGEGEGRAGLTANAEAALIARLNAQYTKAAQPAIEIDRQLKLMESGLAAARRGDMAAGSQAVLVTFQKILDPTSVVRESEYARSAAGQALLSRVQGAYEQLAKGGAGVPVEQLEKFATLAREASKAFSGGYLASVKKRVGATAQRYNIPEELAIEQYDFGGQEAPSEGGWTDVGNGVRVRLKPGQ